MNLNNHKYLSIQRLRKYWRYIILIIITASFIMFIVRQYLSSDIPHINSSYIKLLSKMNYHAFNMPRSADATGTIIRLDNNNAEIIVSDECFSSKHIKSVTIDVSIPNIKYEISNVDKVTASFFENKEAIGTLSAALSNTSVESVHVEFISPKISRITEQKILNRLNNLPEDSICKKLIRRKGNYLIHSSLSTEGMKVMFIEKDGVTANTKGKIQPVSLETKLTTASSLVSELATSSFRYIGYLPWQYIDASGLASEGIFIEPDFKELEAIKWSNVKK